MIVFFKHITIFFYQKIVVFENFRISQLISIFFQKDKIMNIVLHDFPTKKQPFLKISN